MDRDRTGSDVVAELSSGRAWWRLRADDIQSWSRRLPTCVLADRESRLDWIGAGWDGSSDIDLTDLIQPADRRSGGSRGVHGNDLPRAILSGGDARLLLDEIRTRIDALGPVGVALPGHADLRRCLAGSTAGPEGPPARVLAVDFDMGELILPMCIEDWQLGSEAIATVGEIAALMVERLAWAVARRGALVRREHRLRGTFDRRLAALGPGVAPLWLRMEPLRFDDDPANIAILPYQMIDIRLDRHLLWSPSGTERVHTCADVDRQHAGRARTHRFRTNRLAKLQTTGSTGWIGSVALDLIEAVRLDPGEVFRSVRDTTLASPSVEPREIGTNSWRASLTWREGALVASVLFDGGVYSEAEGRFSIWTGRIPHMIIAGAVGRRLDSVVGHAALDGRRRTISRAGGTELGANFRHRLRLISVEEAERRWSVSIASEGKPAVG